MGYIKTGAYASAYKYPNRYAVFSEESASGMK